MLLCRFSSANLPLAYALGETLDHRSNIALDPGAGIAPGRVAKAWPMAPKKEHAMAAVEATGGSVTAPNDTSAETADYSISGTSLRDPATSRTKPVVRRGIANVLRAAVVLSAICAAVVIPLGWTERISGRLDQTTDDAYLKADTSPVSAQVSGQVKSVYVHDYQPVKAGDILAQIDDQDYAAQVARAEAEVGMAEAAIRNAKSQIVLQQKIIAQSEAATAAVIADRDRAKSEYERQMSAESDRWSTAQKREAALADLRRYEAQLGERRADVDAQRHRIDVLDTQREQAEASLVSQQASLEIARINLSRTRILSPVNGIASASRVRIGQFVPVGARILDVIPLPHLYVIANFKEIQLERIRPGQMATVTVDAFPGRRMQAHVGGLAPASGSEFALLPPDNATGNFTKVAQRVAVRIEIDDADGLSALLRPGMSVVPTIHTSNPTGG